MNPWNDDIFPAEFRYWLKVTVVLQTIFIVAFWLLTS